MQEAELTRLYRLKHRSTPPSVGWTAVFMQGQCRREKGQFELLLDDYNAGVLGLLPECVRRESSQNERNQPATKVKGGIIPCRLASFLK